MKKYRNVFIVAFFIAFFSTLIFLSYKINFGRIMSDISSTTRETIKTYGVGDVVKFDPVNYEICDEDSSSPTCHNWYVVSKNNNVYDLYYEGFESNMLWTVKNPVDIIKSYTENWDNRLTMDNSHDITLTDDYGYYFSETKARIITVDDYYNIDESVRRKLLIPYSPELNPSTPRYQYMIINPGEECISFFGQAEQYGTGVITTMTYNNNIEGGYNPSVYIRPLINLDLENGVGNAYHVVTEHEVEFVVDGSTYGDKQTIIENNLVQKPENPTKEGYRFKYWSLEENGSAYNFGTPVTSSFYLYAVFGEIDPRQKRSFELYDTIDFDPVNYEFCDENYEGDTCYQWTVISKNENEYDIYMNYALPSMGWSTANPVDVIKSYTSSWDSQLTVDPSYDVTVNPNYGYKFSETKARMLLASEYNNSGSNIDKVVRRNVIATLLNPDNRYIDLVRTDTEYTTTPSTNNYNLIDYYSFDSNASGTYEYKAYVIPVVHIDLDNGIGNSEERDRKKYTCRRATKNITLGKLNTVGTLESGDAFDCDVDGKGYRERFYYVTDLDSNNDYGVLLYNQNVKQGNIYNFICYHDNGCPGEDSQYFKYDDNPFQNGPRTAITQLPTTSQWTNISLYNNIRDIYDTNENKMVSNFSYEGKAARLLTYKEALKACGVEYRKIYDSYISIPLNEQCFYLTDNLHSHSGDVDTDEWMEKGLPRLTKYNGLPWAYWLENVFVSSYLDDHGRPVYDYNNPRVMRMFGNYQGEEMITIENGNDESDKAIRPVIEVKKTKLYYGLKANVTFNDEERLTVKTIDLGSTVTPVDNQGKTNYHFKHWSLTKTGAEFNFNTAINEDITLYAVYEIDRYNITYNLDGGVVTGNPSTYTVEDTFTLNNPTKDGYEFLGWTGTALTDKTKTVTVPLGSTGDREYTANYKKIEKECKIYITSDAYAVDNENLIISNVPKDETEEQIESNLNIEGTLEKITSETVTVTCDNIKKVYTIKRMWIPHTGMNIVRFTFVFLYSIGIITVLLFINKERLKNKLLKVSIRNKKE